MNPKLLIDAIVQQTTVLIAQLSTAAGLRSPLAHVADQVFLSLAQEIERQGVGRKVVADMFGLALRTYQRKVQRLEESSTQGGRTLWVSVLDFVGENGPIRRERILERFRNDDLAAVSAVLADLVASGFLYSSGRGDSALYRATSEADRTELSGDEQEEALASLLWGRVFHATALTTADLIASAGVEESRVRAALSRLVADGRVQQRGESDEAPLYAPTFLIPVGAEVGWEAAVFDHYQAMVNAIADKVRKRTAGANDGRTVGGTTLHFGIHPGHPFEDRVLGILERVRDDLNALWNDVSAYNREHPLADEAATRVTFYFGQRVRAPGEAEPERDRAGDGEEGAME